MENAPKCSLCDVCAVCICSCSNLKLCKRHADAHLFSQYDVSQHKINKLLLKLLEGVKEILNYELNFRKNIANCLKKQIIHKTSHLISQIVSLSQNAIKKLDEKIAGYNKILTQKSFDITDKQIIERILNTSISTERKEKLLILPSNLVDFYNEELLVETAFFSGNLEERLYKKYGLCVQGHINSVNCVAISNDNKYAASGSADTHIKIWNIEKRNQKHFLKTSSPVLCITYTPDDKHIVSGSYDKKVLVWDTQKKILLAMLEGHSSYIKGIAVTHNGHYIISASSDEILIKWDLRTLKQDPQSFFTCTAHCVNIAKNDKFFVFGGKNSMIGIWDLKRNCVTHKFSGHRDSINCIAITSDNKTAVSGSNDKRVRIWNLDKKVGQGILLGHSSSVESVAFIEKENLVISGSYDNTMILWNLESQSILHKLEGHINWVLGLAVTSDNKYIVSASADYSVNVWDIESKRLIGQMLCHDRSVIAVGIAENNNIVTLSNYGVAVWDTKNKCQKFMDNGKGLCIRSTLVTKDNKYLISACYDKTIKIWNFKDCSFICSLEGHIEEIQCVTLSENNTFIISGSYDQTLRVYSLINFNERAVLVGHKSFIMTVVIMKNDELAASGSGDSTIIIWDLKNFKLKHVFNEDNGLIYGLAVMDNKIISVSKNDDVRIWNVEEMNCESILCGHKNWVICVCASLNKHLIATSSVDFTIKIWDFLTLTEKFTITGNNTVLSISFTKSGNFLVTSSADKSVRVWDVVTGIQHSMLFTYDSYMRSVFITDDDEFAVISADDCTVHIWDWKEKQKIVILSGIQSIEQEMKQHEKLAPFFLK